MKIDRLAVLAGLAGLVTGGGPLAAAAPDLSPARARQVEQLWGSAVAVDGWEVLAERLTRPALDAAVNVKLVSKTLVATLGSQWRVGICPVSTRQ